MHWKLKRGKRVMTGRCIACHKAADRAYRQSPAGKATQKRQNHSAAGKAARARFNKTEKRTAIVKKYDRSDKGKALNDRKNRKKRKNLMVKVLEAINQGIYRSQKLNYSSSRLQNVGISDWPALKLHIELQFTGGMTWDNRGQKNSEWHIDHIIPVKSYLDSGHEMDIERCSNFKNLRPMWGVLNRKKGSKLPSIDEAPPRECWPVAWNGIWPH